jgi:hypothetical protein
MDLIETHANPEIFRINQLHDRLAGNYNDGGSGIFVARDDQTSSGLQTAVRPAVGGA